MNPSEKIRFSQPVRAFGRLLRNLIKAQEAIVAVEFAMIAPVLTSLFFGVTELSDGYIASTKATSVASVAADLIAQDDSVCNPEMTEVFNALNTIMFPYPTNGLMIRVSSLTANNSGVVTVAWSDAQNMVARAVNSTITVPTGVVANNGSVIFAEVTYNYSSPTGHLIYGTLPISDHFYLRPRRVVTIARTAAC